MIPADEMLLELLPELEMLLDLLVMPPEELEELKLLGVLEEDSLLSEALVMPLEDELIEELSEEEVD